MGGHRPHPPRLRIPGKMTEVVTDTGNRRRLPTWMLQENTADKLRKSVNKDTKGFVSEEDTKSQATGSKAKPAIKNHHKTLSQKAETKQQAESLQGCEMRRRTKKATRRDEGPSTSFTTSNESKKKLKSEGISTRKQHVKSKRHKNSEVEVASSERSDEEMSLTVADLLRIADEYISADNEKQCEQQATRDRTSETNYSSSSISSSTIIGGALQAGGSTKILSKCTSGSCSSQLTGNEGKRTENHKTVNFATSITSTGDAAKDMLNVYLGPFLKQSPSKERSVQAIELKGLPLVQTFESKGLPSVQTIESKGLPSVQTTELKGLPSFQAFESKGLPSIQACESKGFPSIQAFESKRLPSTFELDKQLRSHALSNEEVPLMMKKKSSLKDKVALFFD